MRQDKGKLILISGLPGSGKSTLGRWISKYYKIPYIDYDTVIQPFMTEIYGQFYQGQAYDEFCAIWRNCCYRTFWDIVAEQLHAGISVAASAPLSAEAGQADFFQRMKRNYELEAEVLSIVLEVPEKTLYERISERREPRDEQKLKDWERYFSKQLRLIRWDPDDQIIYHASGDTGADKKIKEFLDEGTLR